MSDRAQNTAKKLHDTDHEKHKPSHADNRHQASAKGANEAWQAQIDASKAKKKPEAKPQDKQSKLTLNAEQIKDKVNALNKELNKTKQEGPFWDSHKKPDVDPNKVHHLLDGITSADRQAIDKAFKEQNKKHLGVLETLGTKVDKNTGGYAQVEALLKRQDNKTDHSGSVHTELAKIDEKGKHAANPIDALLHGQNPIEAQKERSQAEERLLNTIYRAGKELKDLKETNQHDYHNKDKRTLEDEVKNNKHLSPEGKAAALIMLQDNWDKDPKKIDQLRRLGLSSHRLDIFEKAMQVSTPQERDMFRKTGGLAQIEKAFGNTDAGAKARDLALIGKEGLEKALADQTWKFSGSNHEQLEDALSKADEKEKALFKKGRDLSLHGDISHKRTAAEKEAIDYYQRVHDKLGLIAPFNDGQRNTWEAKLLGTDKKQQVTPSLDKAFKQNEENVFDNIFHNKEKSAAKINALIHMSQEEQKRYKDNTEKDKTGKTYRQHVMDMVNTQLKEGPERELAKSILGRVARGEDPSKLDKSEQVLYDHVTGADRSTKIEHIEKALESQESRYRISKGLTPKDKALKSVIDAELDDLKKSCGYVGDKTADGKHQLNAYLYKTGHVPPELSALSGLNKKTWLEGILNTPAETRKQLADTRPLKSWETTSTQANLIGHAGKEQQEFIQDLLKRTPPVTSLNDTNVSPEDRMRAFALGIGPSPEEIEKELKTMDSTQKAAMASRYFDRYKHDISDDVVAKVPPDQQRHFQDLLSHADVTLGQKAINAREDHDKHKSPADMITGAFSAAESRVDNDLDKVDDYLHKHGEKQLTKAQQDELKKALEDYRQKEKEFIESKGKAAEAFVNATTTIVTIVGSMVQPELAPLALAKLGVLGGAYRFGAMKLIQGNDFDNSARNITEQLFHGSTDVIFNMVAPANLGMKMGATKTAIKEALEHTASKKFTSGLESALKQQLDNISTKDVLLGSPKAREAIEQAFKEAAIGSTDKGVKEAADTYLKQLQTNTALELLAKETKQAADNIVTGAISTGAAQLTTNIAFPPEGGLTPKELFDKCMKAGGEGAAGAAVFHFGFKGLGMAASGAKGTIGKVLDAAGKDKYFAKDGTVIRQSDGTIVVTGKEPHWLKPGDTIVPSTKAPEAQAPSKDARDITNYMANTGELRRPIPDGYTDVGAKQTMGADGNISAARGATTYDASHDVRLNQFKTDAKTHMNKYKSSHPKASRDELMEELIQWEKTKLGTQTPAEEKAYTSFMTQAGSKRVPVGELMDRRHLSCSERAHLLKILADENIGQGYATIVRGDGTGHKTSNHTWVETGDGKNATVWDSNGPEHKLAKPNTGDKYTAESHLPGYGHAVTNDQIKPGQSVEGSPGWQYAINQPKDNKYVAVVHENGQQMVIPKEQLYSVLPPLASLVKDLPTETARLDYFSRLKESPDLTKDGWVQNQATGTHQRTYSDAAQLFDQLERDSKQGLLGDADTFGLFKSTSGNHTETYNPRGQMYSIKDGDSELRIWKNGRAEYIDHAAARSKRIESGQAEEEARQIERDIAKKKKQAELASQPKTNAETYNLNHPPKAKTGVTINGIDNSTPEKLAKSMDLYNTLTNHGSSHDLTHEFTVSDWLYILRTQESRFEKENATSLYRRLFEFAELPECQQIKVKASLNSIGLGNESLVFPVEADPISGRPRCVFKITSPKDYSQLCDGSPFGSHPFEGKVLGDITTNKLGGLILTYMQEALNTKSVTASHVKQVEDMIQAANRISLDVRTDQIGLDDLGRPRLADLTCSHSNEFTGEPPQGIPGL